MWRTVWAGTHGSVDKFNNNSLPLILPSRPAGLFARAVGRDAMVQDFTEEINEILIAAAEDGCINPSDFQLGRYLQAGGKTFPADLNNYNAADGARYMDALDEFSKRGLAKRISKDLYEFTSRGFGEVRKLRGLQAGRAKATGCTTKVGFVNDNHQVVIRNTGLPGTDHGQQIYQMGCSKCGHVYGTNGSDIHERKCPKCDGGVSVRPGPSGRA